MKRGLIMFLTLAGLWATAALPFGAAGCGAGECKDCHSLSKEQAATILSPLGPIKVVNVEFSQVPGLWSVVVERADGMNIPVFLDFSLKFIIQGEALEITSKENVTRNRMIELNKIDFSSIPLEDALVMGDPKAKHKIVVFDDPECPFCKKLQAEMQAVVAKRPDIAFYIKMLPLQIHPTAYDRAKTIVCEKSLALLEKSLNGEELPKAKCETDILEKNAELAQKLKVVSTPTVIFPDGRVNPGAKTADKIIELLDADLTVKASK